MRPELFDAPHVGAHGAPAETLAEGAELASAEPRQDLGGPVPQRRPNNDESREGKRGSPQLVSPERTRDDHERRHRRDAGEQPDAGGEDDGPLRMSDRVSKQT